MQGDGFLVKELRLGRQDWVMQLFKEDPRDDKRKSHCEGEKDGSAEKKKQIFMLLKVRRKKKIFSQCLWTATSVSASCDYDMLQLLYLFFVTVQLLYLISNLFDIRFGC